MKVIYIYIILCDESTLGISLFKVIEEWTWPLGEHAAWRLSFYATQGVARSLAMPRF